MAKEIERKFLVDRSKIKLTNGDKIIQGYLYSNPDKTVRIRIRENRAYLTIKGRSTGISRSEYEYEIPVSDARELLQLCEDNIINKTRHTLIVDNMRWEIDDFHDTNKGLLLAEIELSDEDEQVLLPDWVQKEVSHDLRYFNSYLCKNPYASWNQAQHQ